ncbi:MAG: sigma-54 dependent transcriptional regulator [bacterium]
MKMKTANILVVDDEEIMRESLSAWLQEDGFQVEAFSTGKEAMEAVKQKVYDAILLDLKLPDMDGLEILKHTKHYQPNTPVLMITAYGSVETAIKAMKQGATDYITKPFNPEELSLTLHHILDDLALRRENIYLKLKLEKRYDRQGIVSKSHKMERIFDLISTIADTRSTVLIHGESGTGKELIARAIHYSSNRSHHPFISVSCAALVESLLESELFGHEKGAFTDAKTLKRGKFELADGGSLFLDEIGEISPKLQLNLLRVLQEREFHRVGGEEAIRVDVRIIAATNKNLEQAVREGSFREDLYYRLNVISIHLPPLRERKEDIPLLVNHFVEKFNMESGKHVGGVSEEVLQILMEHDWPGNVRELENVIERAVIINRGGVILPEDLPPYLLRHPALSQAPELLIQQAQPGQMTLQEVEKAYIQNVLEETGWNIKRTARILGIDRSTLYAKIRRYGLRQEEEQDKNGTR